MLDPTFSLFSRVLSYLGTISDILFVILLHLWQLIVDFKCNAAISPHPCGLALSEAVIISCYCLVGIKFFTPIDKGSGVE